MSADKSTPKASSRHPKRTPVKEEEQGPDDEGPSAQATDSGRRKHDRHTRPEVKPEENEDQSEDMDEAAEDEERAEQMANSFLGRSGGFAGLRHFGGLAGGGPGSPSRFKEMLDQLKTEDPSIQMVALNDLSNILLLSTEDNLAGQFAPDPFVAVLVKLMQPHEITGEENPDMMLLACRCIYNLMEALPSATAHVVYGGAVPILCQKLLEISYIDLAEQALSTLEKISNDHGASIIRDGGLGACLNYLDFFATGLQRTAVMIAANSCRNIPPESFPAVRDVMPILLNTLSSTDQKVVEQGSLCVSRIVDNFKFNYKSIEELVSPDMLQAILRLLIPGTTNLIPDDIHTKFVKVLAVVARASPARAASLLDMDVVDTLYQILTGVSPPSRTDEVASHIDGVVIMQSLIRKQRDQIYETLNVICELLPGLPADSDTFQHAAVAPSHHNVEAIARADLQPKDEDDTRRALLSQNKAKLGRFASILLPTLTHAYTSTVNLGVRQKVLAAQLKMISNLDVTILETALRTVPFASHLASILSQQDHPILVLAALGAAQYLSKRLGHIYDYQFCREGVLTELTKLANRPLHDGKNNPKSTESSGPTSSPPTAPAMAASEDDVVFDEDENVHDELMGDAQNDDDDDEDEEGDDDEDDDEEEGEQDAVIHDDMSPSPSESSEVESVRSDHVTSPLEDIITTEAQRFVESLGRTGDGRPRAQAKAVLEDIRSVANDIQECYASDDFSKAVTHFRHLAKYFGGDALQAITSAELLGSDLVDVLLDTFTSPDDPSTASKTAFLSVFAEDKAQGAYAVTGTAGSSSPFTALVQKLQDLLSRAEHFGVITVNSHSYDSNRSSAASMLAKQLRLKLVADDNSDIPRAYRNIMVSIHAIATFKALDDYLRPRLSFTERGVRSGRNTADMLSSIVGSAEARQRLIDSGILAGALPPMIPHIGNSDVATESRRRPGLPGGSDQIVEPPETSSATTTESEVPPRRMNRKHQQSNTGGADTPTPPTAALECADERQISDEDEDDDGALLAPPLGALAAAAAAAGDREETPDPTAVNMEIASTGKVTARQEDGIRVATPSLSSSNASQPTPSGTPSQPRNRLVSAGGPPSAARRAMSYAAAIQSTPQDWHIEFSINGQPISNETTIYRAVHYQQSQPNEPAPRSLWSAVHPISFKRVPGPPPERSSLSPAPESSSETTSGALPASLHKNPLTSKILRLLAILHDMNTDTEGVLDDSNTAFQPRKEPISLFVNTKLTAKLNRQLEEPLIVASNCLPGWSEDLARLYPFLFPFETRHLFLQSTSFGYSRSMTRWQSTQNETTRRDRHRDERPFLGRLQRQKVRISRSRILESAMKVMELYGASPSVLEVEYFEEVGTGLGPTLEFYSNVSKEFSKKKLKLWRDNESTQGDNSEYTFGKNGLFPAPMSSEQTEDDNGRRILHLFRMMGKFVARAMLDSRIIDISFNPMFFKFSDEPDTKPLGLSAIKSLDSGLYSSLKILKTYVTQKKRIEEDPRLSPAQKAAKLERVEVQGATVSDLGFDFTLPGYPGVELVKDGANVPVSIDNVADYLEKIIDFTVQRGVRRQILAFRAGFSEVFPYSALRAFTPAELVMLFGRVDEDWSLETLTDSIKADHGYNMNSKSVINLLQSMSELDMIQRRDFLQFITGSPKLPIGGELIFSSFIYFYTNILAGFKSLTPMFTVVCKPSEPPLTSDDYLPSVMTCVNYLKMPDYSSLDIMKSRLFTAINEGQGAFHLS